MKESVRIVLVAEHPIVRFRVREMLKREPDLSICAEAYTHEIALEAFKTREADLAVVVMGASPGGAGGVEVIAQLHEVNPALRMVVISQRDEMLAAEQALRVGARGYLMTQHANEVLIPAIRQVLAGHRYVGPRVLQEILERIIGTTGPA